MGPDAIVRTGLRVGITAGPTRAWIDPVRYIANASTGELGARIADAFAERGAMVDLVLGPGARHPQRPEIRIHPIDTVPDLIHRLESLSNEPEPFDVWVHAMAVLDYAPDHPSSEKISSHESEMVLHLAPTPKVIGSFKQLFPTTFLVGFKLETTADGEVLRKAAQSLMDRHRCDLVVANRAPFEDPENHAAWFLSHGEHENWVGPFVGKPEIAEALVTLIESRVQRNVSAQA